MYPLLQNSGENTGHLVSPPLTMTFDLGTFSNELESLLNLGLTTYVSKLDSLADVSGHRLEND